MVLVTQSFPIAFFSQAGMFGYRQTFGVIKEKTQSYAEKHAVIVSGDEL